MNLILKLLFYISSITSLITGIEVWVTGKPTSNIEIIVDNFTLAVFFFLFGISVSIKRRNKNENSPTKE